MDIDRNGLEVLPREECLSLLRRARIGRVAISVDALPAVLPVNFTLIGEDIVFRTNPGAKIDAAPTSRRSYSRRPIPTTSL